jgi:tetratricopeptide (TPR) repeat protein
LPGGLERAQAQVAAAEALVEEHRYDEALEAYQKASAVVNGVAASALTLRLLNGQAWAQLRNGDVDAALALLEQAEELVAAPSCSDLERAEVIFRVGVCRYSRSEIAEAIQLFTQALLLAEQSPSDRLRADVLNWRSRCYRRERDWVAAWEDIERALELAEASSNSWQLADAYFQASLVAQRKGRWVLARTYAERSKSEFERMGDRATVGRVLNNIAGLDHLLGDPARAISRLQEAFSIFVEAGLDVDAGYVLSSQADIHLGLKQFERAETQARKALQLLGDRVDHLQEIGTAQLALGRALAAQDRIDEAQEMIAAAERTFEQARSISHRADTWIAQGDLETRRGNDHTAAAHFKRAVEALQEAEVDF